jgi:hypothetical protein
MTNPVTPPPELVGQWQDESPETQIADHVQYLATRAAQWGADQELGACCEWMRGSQTPFMPDQAVVFLRAARRPKPPSLKEQALHELADVYDRDKIDDSTYDTIRRALEALPND